MNARVRRMTTSGLLLMAALSIGCGSDGNHDGHIMPAETALAPGSASVPATTTAALSSSQNAVVAGFGTAEDARAANETVDALYAVLGAGALQAATPFGGGAVAESSSALQIAAVAGTGESPAVGSDAQLPRLSGLASMRSFAASPQGTQVFTFSENTMVVRSPDGLELTFTGVTKIGEQEDGNPPEGISFDGDVHVVGRLAATERRRDVDLRIRGISGSVRFVQDLSPQFDVTIGADGFSVIGRVLMVSGGVHVTGLVGHIASLTELNGLLASSTVRVQLTDLHVDEVIASARADATVVGLELPVNDERPTFKALFGSADVVLDRAVPQSEGGRIAHVGIEVSRASPLVLTREFEGPASGTVVLTVHYAQSSARDVVTVVFQNGEPIVSGTRTNLSGDLERISTSGDTTIAAGTVRFNDGRQTEHTIEVRRRTGGNVIVFRVRIKNSSGMQTLFLSGTVKPDKTLNGTWTRGGGQTDAAAAIAAFRGDAQTGGNFRCDAGGRLELQDAAGAALAIAQMPEGWNRGL